MPSLEELGYEDNFGTKLLACFYDGAVFSPGVILTIFKLCSGLHKFGRVLSYRCMQRLGVG